MRLDLTGIPNEVVLVTEPGDLIAFVHPNPMPELSRIVVEGQPLPEERRMRWTAPADGLYTWAVVNGKRDILFVGLPESLKAGDQYEMIEPKE